MDTTLNNYKLRCELFGHSMDVRAVTTGPATVDGQLIISGSRDKTVKVWKPEKNEYVEMITYKDHKNFVACIYFLESEQWLCTGSNDSTICLYKEGGYVPILTLKGHESTVCSIAGGVEPRSIISGSWDKTARIWTIDQLGGVDFVVLRGHEAAVWAVASMPSVKKFITASADKCIYYWNTKGEKLRMLKGHTDCVRGILALPDNSLVSCANDAIIRYWNEDGECIQELTGHTNYIYSVSQNAALGKNVIVSCGEDSTLRMWDISTGKELGEPITHPAQSVWAVTCLNNGDIVTAGSDGIIRIFTKNPENFANTTVLNAFKFAVEARKQQLSEDIGGIKKTDLPGPESLLVEGKSEGQTKMVRHGDGSVKCYSWDAGKWNLIGEVMGATGGTQQSSGKTLYDGKEYDYVFSVDVSDTEPPKKLPYNLGEDPWHVAQSFIHRNNLPQTYLDQVANFIITNSQSSSQVPVQPTTSGFQDPFTGASRYTPSSGSGNISATGNVDPFTGASSYSTTSANVEQPKVDVDFTKGGHFPVKSYMSFDTCDPSKILTKLREFNSKDENDKQMVSDALLEAVVRLTNPTPAADSTTVDALKHLLSWPKEILFPVLDVTRLAIRNESIFELLTNSLALNEYIIPQLNSSIPANQLMAVRCLANMMVHEAGRKEVATRLPSLMAYISNIKQGSANMQIALATFYLNVSIQQILKKADGENCQLITLASVELLCWANDPEACYRTMQAIGNLTTTQFSQETIGQIISVDAAMEKIRTLTNTPQTESYAKLNSAGSKLLKRLQSL